MLNFTNLAQGVKFKKLGHFINNNIFENEPKQSSFFWSVVNLGSNLVIEHLV